MSPEPRRVRYPSAMQRAPSPAGASPAPAAHPAPAGALAHPTAPGGRRGTPLRAAAALGALLVGLGCGPEPSRRPDLLLVTVDSLRPDALHCYDPRAPTGRRICALADGGALYRWAIAPAPTTAPSLASVLTSLYPSEHRVRDGRTFLRQRIDTLAERLRQAGYHTGAVVSSPEATRALNFHQGFDHFDDRLPARSRAGYATDRDAEATTDAARSWLAEARRPWFLWVHYQDPHAPYAPPGTAALDRWPLTGTGIGRSTGEPWQRYLAEVAHVDAEFGRLLQGLADRGVRPEVLLAGDHGESFGEDGVYFSHGHSVSLDQVRVPLLWRPVGPIAPQRLSTPVSLLDIAPTLLAAARLPLGDDLRGEPLGLEERPLGRLDVPRTLFAEHADRIAVVSGRSYYSRRRGGAVAVRGGALDPEQLRRREGRVAELHAGPGGEGSELPPTRPASPTGVARLLEPWLAAFEREIGPGPAAVGARGPDPSP